MLNFCCHYLVKTKTDLNATIYIFIDLECKIGDGSGGSEINTEKLFSSSKECIDHVRENYPEANGATFQTSCIDSCKCFAEIGMTDWLTNDYSLNNYESCMYKPGNFISFNCQKKLNLNRIFHTFKNIDIISKTFGNSVFQS